MNTNLTVTQINWVCSSVVEHGIADPMVAGSIPVTPFLNLHILVSLDGQDTRFSPWRPGDTGSIPGRGIDLCTHNKLIIRYYFDGSRSSVGRALV